jgi:hypothetical protein
VTASVATRKISEPRAIVLIHREAKGCHLRDWELGSAGRFSGPLASAATGAGCDSVNERMMKPDQRRASSVPRATES